MLKTLRFKLVKVAKVTYKGVLVAYDRQYKGFLDDEPGGLVRTLYVAAPLLYLASLDPTCFATNIINVCCYMLRFDKKGKVYVNAFDWSQEPMFV